MNWVINVNSQLKFILAVCEQNFNGMSKTMLSDAINIIAAIITISQLVFILLFSEKISVDFPIL